MYEFRETETGVKFSAFVNHEQNKCLENDIIFTCVGAIFQNYGDYLCGLSKKRYFKTHKHYIIKKIIDRRCRVSSITWGAFGFILLSS